MSWITPRLWRSPKSRFTEDEPLHSAAVYTPEVLADIAGQGFDGIWMRGRLRELTRSTIFPELDDSSASQRVENLREVVARCQAAGMKLFLFFNEPLALPATHPFWNDHPELLGQRHHDPDTKAIPEPAHALCTSTPEVIGYMRESIEHLYADLPGLGGVILITASEYHTHCWSHYPTKDASSYMAMPEAPMACPRCAAREPADLVAELVGLWTDAARNVSPSPQVWAWNWSWSMWYDEPQAEIVERLPAEAKLMMDFERGGMRSQQIGEVAIDEYSLGYVGPSERFVKGYSAARNAGLEVAAKLQLNTTHELATVPNLPLIPNLYEKLRWLDEHEITGIMGSWNFGNCATLNTAAFRAFVDHPDWRGDKQTFLHNLASAYFTDGDVDGIIAAWGRFCDAFAEYPFSIPFLYYSPINYAPALELSLDYHGRPMGPSWIPHSPWGESLENTLGPLSLEACCKASELMAAYWAEGIGLYEKALDDQAGETNRQELSTAQMIDCCLQSMVTILNFHHWRKGILQEHGLTAPCDLPADETSDRLIAEQARHADRARRLMQADDRLGYHQEPGTQLMKCLLPRSSGANR